MVATSSSCRTASTDLSDPFSPPVSIVHRSREVFQAISCIGTELLYIGSSWSSYLCLSMWRGPPEYVVYEFILTSPACLVRLTWIVFVMGGRWPYNCYFVRCYLQDLFSIACSIFVLLPFCFFSVRLVSAHVVHPYSSVDTTATWKNCVLFYWSCLTSLWPIAYR